MTKLPNFQMIGQFPEITSTAGLMKISGIYAILHRETGRIYIGSTVSLKSRIGCHRGELRHGKHDNSYLQNAWNKHSKIEGFIWVLLEICENEKQVLLTTEQACMWRVQTGKRKSHKGWTKLIL